MTLADGLFEWRLATDKGYAEISGSVITGLVVGTDTVTLYYPVGQGRAGRKGLSDGTAAARTGDGKAVSE